VGSEQGTIEMEDLAFDAESGDLRFTIDMQGAVIELTGNYMDGLLSGDWSAPQVGAAGTWSATMTQPAEPAADDEDEADADEASDADEPNPAKRWHDAMRFDIHDEVVTTHNDRDPTPSPDGKHLSFRRGLGDLIILDLASGDEHALVQWWDRSLDWRWSPCSNYIAYAVQDDDFNADIFIARADGSDGVYRRHNGSKEHAGVNVTMHPDSDWSPRWSADGKILAFISERSDEEYDVYRVYLDKDLEALRGKQLEDYYDQAVADAKKRKPIDPVTFDDDADDENGEGDAEADASADDIPQLDLDDAYLRLTRITNFPGSEFGLELTPGGDRFIFTGTDGSRQLLSVDWRGGSKKSLGSPASVQHISLDGSKLVLVSGGQGQTMSSSGGSRDTVSIDHTLRIDLQQQNAQKFREAARELGEAFYHPTMKGLDWEHLTEAYGRLAEQTRTSNEFADVANRLLGELNGSHLAIRPPGDVGAQAQSNGRLGIDATRLESGAYRVDRVLDQGPAASGDMKLEAGDIITAVEFETITPETTLEEMLKGRVGEETVVTIRRDIEASEGETEQVTVDVLLTPTSYGGERNLRYLDWTERRRAKVEELSDGRLGYLHIRAMSQASLEDFERDLFAAAYGKDGLIVDVRNNGGGWTADRVMASLTVQRHAYTVPRGADPSYTDGYPQDRLFIQRYLKPVNMMCNEKSFSNAEIVSHAFKTTGRGTLVGQQTYGGVISTGGFSLIDGTFVRMPFRGWYVLDGTDMENNGAMPDILIPQTPEHETMQYDAQLEAAVNDLLRRI
jgi:tricorn protease